MKIIIAGSREVTDFNLIKDAMDQAVKKFKKKPLEIVSGGARGVDKLGEKWAEENGVNCVVFEADWSNIKGDNVFLKKKINPYTKKEEFYNANAGFERNQKMAEYADALVAINLGTPGTNDMINRMKKLGKKVYEWSGMEPLQDDEFEVNF
jgi:predicted Rossmann-fold nucleotide-binding protein